MPVNLNSLIRFKTLDTCLGNPFIKCTIQLLIDKCSSSISASKGVDTSVSERTIRNDIRILRSDILGFNAPIVFEDGAYRYSKKEFSIFKTPIYQKDLLIEIQNLLVENMDLLDNKKLPYLLLELSKITNNPIAENILNTPHLTKSSTQQSIFEKKLPNKYSNFQTKLNQYALKKNKKSIHNLFKRNELFRWELIFESLSD